MYIKRARISAREKLRGSDSGLRQHFSTFCWNGTLLGAFRLVAEPHAV